MNLTGGQFKGIKIDIPKNTRPTLSKVRQGVFNMLNQFDFKDKTFLDMFSGSALMSLEALSRGYNVLSLELNFESAKIIKKNYEKIKQKPKIIITNALNFKTEQKYEIIYIDPPWNFDYSPIIKKAYELLDKNGVIAVEYDKEQEINISDIIERNNLNLKIIRQKKYGRCLVDLLKKDS